MNTDHILVNLQIRLICYDVLDVIIPSMFDMDTFIS